MEVEVVEVEVVEVVVVEVVVVEKEEETIRTNGELG